MGFNSIEYGVFLVAVYFVYWALGSARAREVRLWLLLGASYYFYGCWNAKYVLLIAGGTAINYAAGLAIARAEARGKKIATGMAVTLSLFILAVFKYNNFFIENVNTALSAAGFDSLIPAVHIVLPVGISFYTFQALAYTIDVYRGHIPAVKSPRDFFLFVSFFPQLVAGPIVRARDLVPQLQGNPEFREEEVLRGLYQVIVGLVKKMVLADLLAVELVDKVFAHPDKAGILLCWLAMYGYIMQIYLDFSGYSDIAIGSARMLGIKIPPNFNRPYLARNVREYWARWHISFTTWLRDYLYIPLGGSRRGLPRMYLAIFITMLLGGFWHGANWTMVLWGAIHGVIVSINRALADRGKRLGCSPSQNPAVIWLQRLFTINQISFGLVLFRSPSISAALHYYSVMFTGSISSIAVPLKVWALLFFAFFLHFTPTTLRDRLENLFSSIPLLAKAVGVALALGFISLAKATTQPFFYFQF